MTHSALVISPATTTADLQSACEILIEVAKWLSSIGQPLWKPESLVASRIFPAPDAGIVYLATIDGKPAGTFLLQNEDPVIWSDVPRGEAYYLHKLAVRRRFANQGLARQMLDFAVNETRAAGRRFLRLDCAPRPKLCRVYESAGFQFHSDRIMGTFQVRRYQRSTMRASE